MSSTTMAKYRRIMKEKEKTTEEEIRVTAKGFANSYIAYGARMLLEKKLKYVLLKASGNAIAKACIVAEVLRRRIKNLAMTNYITNIKITDQYEPKEDGLDDVVLERTLSVLEIKLSTEEGVLDKAHIGYQEPLDEKDVEEFPHNFGGGMRRGRGGGRGRGGRGRGEDRGRGRYGRGRGRGGRDRRNYSNERGNYSNERRNYSNERGNYSNERGNYSNERRNYSRENESAGRRGGRGGQRGGDRGGMRRSGRGGRRGGRNY